MAIVEDPRIVKNEFISSAQLAFEEELISQFFDNLYIEGWKLRVQSKQKEVSSHGKYPPSYLLIELQELKMELRNKAEEKKLFEKREVGRFTYYYSKGKEMAYFNGVRGQQNYSLPPSQN